MKKLIRYLTHIPLWQKLPPVPRMYSVVYESSAVDHDTSVIMQLAQTRCPQGVEILKRRHSASAHELALALPRARRRRRTIAEKLLALARRAVGELPYDPMRSIARRHMRRGLR